MDRSDVEKVASLARLKLDDRELSRLGAQLTQVLDYVAVLNEVETDDIEPMAHAVELSNVFREDATTESLSRDAALKNSPCTDGQFFLVPRILDADS